MKIIIKQLTDLPVAAHKFLDLTGKNRVFAFYGGMGAGKTTIIKAICEELGATDLVSSPSFTLVNEYRTNEGSALYHIDFFRIRNLSEVFDFGIEEYLSSGSYCFIEWPELVEEILPENTVKVKIRVGEEDERIIHIL
jgi:tRNA threonylcarbamoyladenosine biosynthesis protein TsaE